MSDMLKTRTVNLLGEKPFKQNEITYLPIFPSNKVLFIENKNKLTYFKKIPVRKNVKILAINGSKITFEGKAGQVDLINDCSEEVTFFLEVKENCNNLVLFKPKYYIYIYSSNQKHLISFKNKIKKSQQVALVKFSKYLTLKGIGYKVELKKRMGKNILTFNLGQSHTKESTVPDNIEVSLINPVTIFLKSNLDSALGNYCSRLKDFANVDVYNGKGIFLLGEEIPKKDGKKK